MISPVFIAHGSPMMAIEDTQVSRFLAEYGSKVRPRAIIIFTAHWESETLAISSPEGKFETIYDFGGFPPELFAKKYPGPGDPKLAAKAADRFRALGIPVRMENRGLDHGSWVPLLRMYPDADIPVVQISVHPYLPAKEQYRIGTALRGLSQEDVLIVGSGVTVHNLSAIKWGLPSDREPEPWAVEFDDWLVGKMAANDWEDLFQYDTLAPHAELAVPRPEHFVPLFLSAGSAEPGSVPEVIHRSYEYGVLSYLSMKF